MVPALFSAIAFASAAFVQTGPKALDDLIERSGRIKTCSARWRMTRSDAKEPRIIRFDFQSPDLLRFDTTEGDAKSSTWWRGSAMTFRGSDAKDAVHAQIDLGAARADIRAAEAVLHREFPADPKPEGGLGAALSIGWSFDAAAQAGQFDFTAMSADGLRSPFGWLTTLQGKNVEPTRLDDKLRYVTDDGHFEVTLSATTGVLESLVGHSPNATITVEIESIEIDQPLEAGRLDPPADAPAGEDMSPQWRLEVERSAVQLARRDFHEQILSAARDVPWNDELRTRIDAVMRALAELEIRTLFDEWSGQMRDWVDGWGSRASQARASGEPDERVESALTRARQELLARLDAGAKGLLSALPPPEERPAREHASDLLAIERDVAARLFRERVREPLLAKFDQATSKPGKGDGR